MCLTSRLLVAFPVGIGVGGWVRGRGFVCGAGGGRSCLDGVLGFVGMIGMGGCTDELLVWLVEEDGIVGLFLGWLEKVGVLKESNLLDFLWTYWHRGRCSIGVLVFRLTFQWVLLKDVDIEGCAG